ncbi:MAG: MBL fold metallo-hydrolase [Cyclobacteriaceae bacterium]
MRCTILILLLVHSLLCSADYLTAYNETDIRIKPQAGSPSVIDGHLKVGDILLLLDSGYQTNGYYHVQPLGKTVTGWIYRSQVKRIFADPPKFMTWDNYQGMDLHIVDVGAGLGCIIRTPAGKYIIYDGGNGNHVYKYLQSLLKPGGSIDNVIVSHTDSDHWDAIKEIAQDYKIENALYTSYRPDKTPDKVQDGIDGLTKESGIVASDLAKSTWPEDTVFYDKGDFKLRFITGFGEKDDRFAKDLKNSASKLRNAASIVVRLEYKDQNILFTGDIVGLKECDAKNCDCSYDCISTEKYLKDSLSHVLDAKVMIAPHHGARNGSCPDFIEAVSPEYVVFSAGNVHNHPHQVTAYHYNQEGVLFENMYRTDLGRIPNEKGTTRYDANPCNDEWVGVNTAETIKDISMDDHIRIQMSEEGHFLIDYVK